MGIFSKYFGASKAYTKYKMISDLGGGFYAWDGKIYQSDIVRACIRPKVKAVGKLVAKHLRNEYKEDGSVSLKVNPEPYMRFLLEEPNEFMTMQKLLEKVTTQLCLNKNAFILIIRNDDGIPVELYPIPAATAEMEYKNGLARLKCYFQNGKWWSFDYADIIHLKEDFNDNDVFGSSIAESLTPLMNTITTIDQGIVKAIKNSSIIRWLIKYTSSLRDDDLKKKAKEFADDFLDIQNGTGVAAIDSKADAKQIEQKDYVPNAPLINATVDRIYSLFNTNKKIVQSAFNEDEWNAYYEAEIEPVVIDLNSNFTNKLFSRKERGYGNKIVFGALNLATASMQTKIGLQAMVDRGALTPNEWRAIFALAPRDGGDEFVMRLDTSIIREVTKNEN